MKFRISVVALAALAVAACSDNSTAPADLAAARAPGANLWIGDAQPPVVTAIVTGSPMYYTGWYFDGNVSVTWSITSDLEVLSESGCEPQVVSTDTPGITFTCEARSLAGTTTQSVTIKRDVVGPVLTLTNNGATFAVDQTINITCSATDATSGVDVDCADIGGDALSWTLGDNLTMTGAQDVAGNTTFEYVRFRVVVTSDGLCALAKRWITPAGAATSLCQSLKNGHIESFQKKVNGLIDKGGISSSDAATLTRLSNAL